MTKETFDRVRTMFDTENSVVVSATAQLGIKSRRSRRASGGDGAWRPDLDFEEHVIIAVIMFKACTSMSGVCGLRLVHLLIIVFASDGCC